MSWLELKEDALKFNIAAVSGKAPLDKIYAVLKDNAYGHGLLEFGSMCAKYGIKNAVVRDKHESIIASSIFENTLCLAELNDFDAPSSVHFAINSIDMLQKIPARTKIHLKIDTGMHRNGVDVTYLQEALELIVSKNIELCGVFSHLRNADELCSDSFWQEKNFLEAKKGVVDFCKTRGLKIPIFHLQNSAGLFRSGSLGEFDMARVGIALYGYLEMPKSFKKAVLRPVMSLWADKMASRALSAANTIGYGATGKLSGDSVVSVYDIGYADGFLRVRAEGDYILPNGSRLIGRVSMDNICVESNDDHICVFDDAGMLARRYGTISYEVLTRLSPKIRRVIV